MKKLYLGEFANGNFNGIGKLAYFKDGIGTMIYYGTWVDGKKSARGRYYYDNNINYIGNWLRD